MTHTTRHSLPQWSKDDRIQMADFNNAMATLDAAVPKIVTGTYTGNGSASQTISLPFTPKAVLVVDGAGKMCVVDSHYFAYGGLAVTGANSSAVSITTNGFIARYNTSTNPRQYTNNSNTTYFYLAIG